MTPTSKVAIAGAGLSGLCLAQHLHQAGIDVHVYETDPGPFTRPQGYRITIDHHGIAALRASLPDDLFHQALETGGTPGGYFRFTNAHLRDAIKLTFKATPDGGRQVDRQVLRAILLTGLKDRVHYNKTATAVSHDLMLRFRDGTTAPADVVVGADGIRSALRRQIAPGAEPTDTTSAGIYGRTPLRQAGHSVVPQALNKSGVLAIGPEPGRAFFFTTMEFSKSPDDDYVMWGLVLNRDEMPRTVDSTALQSLASGFHPLVRRLIDTANHDATVLTTFAVGTRPTRWPLPRATLIGDAVHAMPPFGAHGGNTALRDAALLGRNLIQAHSGTISWESAIATYQTEMPPYAFKAVDSAAGQLRRLTDAGRFQRWLIQQLLPRLHRVTVPEPR